MLTRLKKLVGMSPPKGNREHNLGVPLTDVVIVTPQGTYHFQIDKMFLQPESSTVMIVGRESCSP